MVLVYTCQFPFKNVSGISFLSSPQRLGAKVGKMDNRNLLGFCLLFALVGSILVADWQSIGQDPCTYFNSTIEANSSVLEEGCEALSSSSHQCFWNPQSRITGDYCNLCFPVCLSREKSINLYQFGLGVLLLALSAPLGFVFVSAVASDITSVDSQVQQNYYH